MLFPYKENDIIENLATKIARFMHNILYWAVVQRHIKQAIEELNSRSSDRSNLAMKNNSCLIT
jgi:hypothetical protein